MLFTGPRYHFWHIRLLGERVQVIAGISCVQVFPPSVVLWHHCEKKSSSPLLKLQPTRRLINCICPAPSGSVCRSSSSQCSPPSLVVDISKEGCPTQPNCMSVNCGAGVPMYMRVEARHQVVPPYSSPLSSFFPPLLDTFFQAPGYNL